jgi:Tol biopolymer transport system component
VTADQESAKRQRRHILAWALLTLVSLGLVFLAVVRFQFLRPVSHQSAETVPLTSFPGRQITPAFSPDGRQVAFAWDGEKRDNFDIYETSEARELTSPSPGFCDGHPAFSPNGEMLAFVRAPSSESSEIYELPVRPDGKPGGEPRRVTYDDRNINGFDWDADGRRIIYSSGMPGAMNL